MKSHAYVSNLRPDPKAIRVAVILNRGLDVFLLIALCGCLGAVLNLLGGGHG